MTARKGQVKGIAERLDRIEDRLDRIEDRLRKLDVQFYTFLAMIIAAVIRQEVG